MAGERVLVVEDTELLRRIYTDKLTQEGYEVVAAGDGMEALEVLRSETVDLILLDLIMPRVGGLEVLEVVKQDPRTKSVPVIILSNLGQEGDMERGIALGAIDYLIKNEAKPADIAAKIRLTLDHMAGLAGAQPSFKLIVRDREADADAFVAHAKLARRFWCPACEVELALEVLPKSKDPGWYDAHLVCPSCGRTFHA